MESPAHEKKSVSPTSHALLTSPWPPVATPLTSLSAAGNFGAPLLACPSHAQCETEAVFCQADQVGPVDLISLRWILICLCHETLCRPLAVLLFLLAGINISIFLIDSLSGARMRVRGAPQLLRNPLPVPCFSHFCVAFFLCFITSASFALCSAERVKEAKSRSGLAVSSTAHADHCLSVPSSHTHPVSLSFVYRRRTPQRGYCQSFTSNVCKKYLGDERVYVTSPLLQGNKEESISKCEFKFTFTCPNVLVM